LQRQSSGVLTVSTSPDFAAKWLVVRRKLTEAPHLVPEAHMTPMSLFTWSNVVSNTIPPRKPNNDNDEEDEDEDDEDEEREPAVIREPDEDQ
jgi:hypothetical protein